MAQIKGISWTEVTPLPDAEGFAGMYAGVTSGVLVAMGGANFPQGRPWENGKKKWYDKIFLKPQGKDWVVSETKMPATLAYGVSVSYKNKIFIAGGCTDVAHVASVYSFEWNNGQLEQERLPDMPRPLAYMTGALMGNLLIVLGGTESPTGEPTKTALLLDLDHPETGWKTLDPWPGPERTLPVCGVWNDQLFLMSGENSFTNSFEEKIRNILTDNYRLSVHKTGNRWIADWKKMSAIPRGLSAAGNLPLIGGNKLIAWGGVDSPTGQYRDPKTHPGMVQSVLAYYPENDTWEFLGYQNNLAARVTLAVIPFENGWAYVSGEVKPGIRTPSIIKITH